MDVTKMIGILWENYADFVTEQITEYLNVKNSIDSDNKTVEETLIRKIIESIYTAGFSSQTATKYADKFGKIIGFNIEKIASLPPEEITKKVGMGNKKNRKVVKLAKFIKSNNLSVSKWAQKLAKNDKVQRLGKKSDDDFLIGCGYLDRLPIDTLTSRFFERMGLLEYGVLKYKIFINPLDKNAYERLHKIMTNVYKECGLNIKIKDKEFKLSKNLGIIDRIVWTHCNRQHGTCLDNPKCNECCIKEICEYKN